MAKWFEIRKGADFNKIGEKYGISPLLARIIRNRDIVEDEQIEIEAITSMTRIITEGKTVWATSNTTT